MEPTTTDSTGMAPADAGSIPANPIEIATSSAATSSAVAPVPAVTATPRPVSQPTTALTSPTTTTTGVAAAASDTPALPQSADSNLLLLLGGGAALVIAVLGAWQLSRQSAKKDGGRGPCDSLKQILEAKKQELAMVTSKIEIERALAEALKEKVASVAKEKAEEAVAGALGETAKEAKRLYDEVREKYELAQKALELLKSTKARIEGEVEKSEAAYAACCKGVQAGKALGAALEIPLGQKKVVKFRDHLANMILAGEKDATWRLFDEKNLSQGDEVDFLNWNTGEKFGEATLVQVREKKMGELESVDFDGHEKFESEEDMYQHYRMYYGDKVGPDTVVKIIKFKFRS